MGILNNLINNILTKFSKSIHNKKIDNTKINNKQKDIEEEINILNINFPDENFKSYIEGQMAINLKSKDDENFNGFTYEEKINYLKNLKIICINWQIDDITFKNYCEFFKTLPQLDTLGLSQCGVKDFSPLSQLENIQYLDISNNYLTNIDFLCGLKNLCYLNIYYAYIK